VELSLGDKRTRARVGAHLRTVLEDGAQVEQRVALERLQELFPKASEAIGTRIDEVEQGLITHVHATREPPKIVTQRARARDLRSGLHPLPEAVNPQRSEEPRVCGRSTRSVRATATLLLERGEIDPLKRRPDKPRLMIGVERGVQFGVDLHAEAAVWLPKAGHQDAAHNVAAQPSRSLRQSDATRYCVRGQR